MDLVIIKQKLTEPSSVASCNELESFISNFRKEEPSEHCDFHTTVGLTMNYKLT